MGVRIDGEPVVGGDAGTPPVGEEPLPPPRRVNVSGDLDDLLDHRPFFHTRLRGYDRLEVDNYATWVEAELRTARRQSSHLLTRYGTCAAELERLRRVAARPARHPQVTVVTERLGEILRLAAEEAAGITAAGIDEAERIVAEARVEAEARLQKVRLIREAAVAAREEARRERAEAAAVLAGARAQAAALLSAAEAERHRLVPAEAGRPTPEAGRMRDEPGSTAGVVAARRAGVPAGAEPTDAAVQADHRGPLATSAH